MHRSTIVFNRLVFVFLAAVLLTLSGCGGVSIGSGFGFGKSSSENAATPAQPGQPAPADQGQKVKVALLVPLSGRNAQLGQSLLNAAQMALFDVGGGSFELLPRDTKGTAEGAADAAHQVINEGAQLILGPVFAEEVRSVKPAAKSANINIIAFSTNYDLADNNTFVIGFLPFDQIERIATYATKQNLKRIGLIAPASDYGRTVTSAYQTMATRVGIITPQAITIQPDSPASFEAVKRFAQYGSGFDAVFMPFGGNSATSIAAALNAGGMPPGVRRLGTGLLDDPALAQKPELNGTWFAAPAPEARTAFEQKFQQTYSYMPPRLSTLAYDATALAAVLSQRGGSSPVFDRASITNPNGFAGLDGIFRFRQNGMAERGLAVLEIRDGRIQVIDPAPITFQPAPPQAPPEGM